MSGKILHLPQQVATPASERPGAPLVGRDAELAVLHQRLETALQGPRQVVFIAGEPGIGKTALVDTFLAQLRERTDVCITSGQCVEQYGPGEAYLPLLEATTRLCRAPGGEQRIEALQRYAPSWLAQLPGLTASHEPAHGQQRLQGTNRERMLREMAEAAELFAARRGLVLVLEDLHWSDVSTLEWLTYMARRREPAKLLILGTYRPADVLASNHPLRGIVQELQARSQCEELRLAPLTEEAITEYLCSRFTVGATGRSPLQELAPLLYRRTGGNALFLINTVDYLIRQGVLVEGEEQWTLHEEKVRDAGENIPDTLRQLIERQIERLEEQDQLLLDIASVSGMEFATAAVAAGLPTAPEAVEERCEQLARKGQFIRSAGVEEWPDGTISGRYGFAHALYQQVLYGRITEARRVRLHRVLGMCKEQAYGKHAREIAGELAAHFAAGRDPQRAVTYSTQAAETAIRRHAHQEAVVHLKQGLSHLQRLPDTPERAQQELPLQLTLGEQLTSLQGFGVDEVERAFARALELCRRLGETPQMFRVLLGLWAFYVERAELTTARELAEQLLRLAQQVTSQAMPAWANLTMGITLHFAGAQPPARQYLEQCLAFYAPQDFRTPGSPYDPAVLGSTTLGPVLWLLGYPDQALAHGLKGLALARELTQPYSVIYAANLVIRTRLLRGEREDIHTLVEELISLCREQGFVSYLAVSLIVQGWLLTEQGRQEEGIAQIRRELLAWRATGAESARPYYLALLAEIYGKAGAPDEGLSVLSECWPWMEKTQARVFEAELYRLRGTLTLEAGGWRLQTSPSSPQASSLKPQVSGAVAREAEGYFLKAVDIARAQQAKSLELRATTSLARLWQSQGKHHAARNRLSDLYTWFTEGFDTKDLQDAAALLRELGGSVKREDVRREAEGGNSLAPSVHSLAPERETRDEEPETPVLDFTQHPASSLQPSAPSLFRREGEYWTLAFEGVSCRMGDTRGLHYLAQLLHHPHEELHVLRLVTGDKTATAMTQHAPSSPRWVDDHADADHASSFTDLGELLDPQARVAYRRRINDLQEELEEAERLHDQDRVDHLRDELEFLTRELAQAVGLGGRARQVGSPAERARVAVTKAIKNVLKKIHKHHPALGQHLAHTIKTGTHCSYTPDPLLPISWQL